MQKDKIRLYALARELNIETKDLLDICRQAGIDAKNQLSSLDPDQRDLVEQMVKGGGGTAVAVAPPVKPAAPVIPTVGSPMRDLTARPARREPEPVKTPPSHTAKPVEGQAAKTEPPVKSPISPSQSPPAAAAKGPQPPTSKIEPPTPSVPEATAGKPSDLGGRVPDLSGRASSGGGTASAGKVPDLGGGRSDGGARPRNRPTPRPGMVHAASPPPVKQRPLRPEVKKQEPVQKPIAKPPPVVKGGPVNVQDIVNKPVTTDFVPPVAEFEDEEGGDKGHGKVRPGGVVGREQRHKERTARRKEKGRENETKVLLLDEDEPHGRLKDRINKIKQRQKGGPTQPRKGKVPIEMPISVRALSEAIGVSKGDLLFRLTGHGAPPTININSTVDAVMAETIALDVGCELEIKKPANAEEQLLAGLERADSPEDLVPRAPVVTIMGHVDHGKTSLLDKIRVTDIAATEAGGITQVIRAWRVEHGGRPVTFLDTPGHEAFTKMRARGANVTDIAVIVVAADDGVMPQTEEAISHAKAAEVPMVVAINKVDLPNANILKTRQQLYSLNLLPDNMGGDVPFVETSAATGKGVNDLLDVLSLVAETMLELKANPNKPAVGTCLEAMLTEGEGVLVTLLVQDGTLHRGDVLLCGATYGRVRALYDDLGRPIDAAGPSVPCRLTGLAEVPQADDPFQVVPDLSLAREIADKRRERFLESSLFKREPVRLESLMEAHIAELKVILKADFRGSIEAIRKELEKLKHAEVRVRVLHAATGGITESDVQLALTSPQDSIIVGFNVVPDDRAKDLAEEKGVQIREYDIIYKLTEDVKAALEGKLKPREDVIHLGRAVVRDTFKITRVGTIAGCYVTQGTIERSAKVRLIREGVVIYPPADRSVGLESLKRFKDDVREVREGFECGIKIAGYDDVKVGDVIEAFRIEQVQRTL